MPSSGQFWYGSNGFLFKKNTGGGTHRIQKLGLICNQPTYLYNKFKPGFGGVGASNISNRRAKNRLATVCTTTKCGSFYSYLGRYNNYTGNPNGYFPIPL